MKYSLPTSKNMIRISTRRTTVTKITPIKKLNKKLYCLNCAKSHVQMRPGRTSKLTPKFILFIRRLLAEFPRESPTDVANEVNEMVLVNVYTNTIKLILN